MVGIKRKDAGTDKIAARSDTAPTLKVTRFTKKRRLTPQPKSESESDVKIKSETSVSDSSDERSCASSVENEAVIFGPNAQERGEAETDSDPIVESDTTEHSGDDDGVSWPSDDEEASASPPKAVKNHDKSKVGKDWSSRGAATVQDNATGAYLPYKIARSTADVSIIDSDIAIAASSSRESHAKQKAVALERKAAKPNADSIARTKKLWERLRRKSHVPKGERDKLVAELFDIITGHIKDFVFKHDSVRVIQTALKYAKPDQRLMIATELRGEYRALAESKYAKFLIGKLLVHGDEHVRDMIVPEMYGHVRRMIKHPEASWILDDIYRGVATPKQKAILLREWYGAEFAIFKAVPDADFTADLTTILAKYPEKRKPVMHALYDLINQCVQKKTTGFTMLHDAILQYYLNLQPGSSDATEFLELLKSDEEGDLLKNLAFTKSGAHVVCLALAYGNAKDRKIILRTYKDTVQTLSYDTYGHQVLLAAYDVIDDTVLTAKTVFPELLGKDPSTEESQRNLLAAASHLIARIPLLYLFTGPVKSILSNEDQKILNEIHAIRTLTSKKDPNLRRKELLASLSPSLLAYITVGAQDLVASSFGCQFMTDILLNSVGDRTAALESIAGLAPGHIGMKSGLHAPFVGRMLKSLVQGGRFNQKTRHLELSDPPLGFNNLLYSQIRTQFLDWRRVMTLSSLWLWWKQKDSCSLTNSEQPYVMVSHIL